MTTDDGAVKLLPCAFCGAADEGFHLQAVQSQDLQGNPKDWSVECAECAAFGPVAATREEAEALWNVRPTLATADRLARGMNGAEEALVEATAQWLHDEGGFDEAWQATWPEHADDTGQRDGAFVKMVPSDVQAKFRDVARRLLVNGAVVSALRAPPSDEPKPEWGNAETVGNLIAQLRTMPADQPIYGAYHIIQDDGPALLRVKGLTLSRERVVDGRTIDEKAAVPYSIVAWTGSKEPAAERGTVDREAIATEIAKSIYGDDFDPFQSPETFDQCEEAAGAILALIGGASK